MKIVCISDLHGYLPTEMPKGDVLVIAGDICPATDHSAVFQQAWLSTEFNTWLDAMKYNNIVCIKKCNLPVS